MKKVLLPIDGSTRSLRTIEMANQLYNPGEVEITLLTVLPAQNYMDRESEVERRNRKAMRELETFAELLKGFTVKPVLLWGNPGPEIVHYAEHEAYEDILMTRSTRGPFQKLGSVAIYVVRNAANMNLLIMREPKE